MRNEKGQFVKGHTGNPGGRPKRPDKPQYLGILKKMLTPKKWRDIIQKAIEDAIKGDRFARTWLSDYALGKPIQPIEVEGQLNVMTLDMWKEVAAERVEEVDALGQVEVGHTEAGACNEDD